MCEFFLLARLTLSFNEIQENQIKPKAVLTFRSTFNSFQSISPLFSYILITANDVFFSNSNWFSNWFSARSLEVKISGMSKLLPFKFLFSFCFYFLFFSFFFVNRKWKKMSPNSIVCFDITCVAQSGDIHIPTRFCSVQNLPHYT